MDGQLDETFGEALITGEVRLSVGPLAMVAALALPLNFCGFDVDGKQEAPVGVCGCCCCVGGGGEMGLTGMLLLLLLLLGGDDAVLL